MRIFSDKVRTDLKKGGRQEVGGLTTAAARSEQPYQREYFERKPDNVISSNNSTLLQSTATLSYARQEGTTGERLLC